MNKVSFFSNILLLKHAIFYTVGRVAAGVIGLISLSVFTKILSPDDYGRYSVIVATALMICGVGFQWLRHGLLRFKNEKMEDLSELLGTIGFLFFFVVGVVVLFFSIIGIISGKNKFNFSSLEVVSICSIAFSQAWFELAADAARTELKPWRYSVAALIRSILSLLFGVVFTLYWENVFVTILGISLGYFISSFFAAPRWLTGVLNIANATKDRAASLLRYGAPLGGTFLMIFTLDTADRLMLASMQGYAEAGIYASAYNIAQFSIGTLLAGVGLGTLPIAIKSFQASNPENTRKLLEYNFLLAIFVCVPSSVGLAIVSPLLNSLMLGNYVSGKSDIITAVIALAIGLAVLRSSCFDVVFMLYRRSWIQALIIGFAALINILLNFYVIPRCGAVGAATSSLLAFCFAMLGSIWFSRKLMKISINRVDVMKIIFSTTMMGCVVYFSTKLYAGWLGLIFSILSGVLTYVIFVVLTNLLGSRDFFIYKLNEIRLNTFK